jgi:hypothetical protein
MASPQRVGYPISDENDRALQLDNGSRIMFKRDASLAMIIATDETNRFERKVFRTGVGAIGFYEEAAIPFFLFRIAPAPKEDGMDLGSEVGDIRARAPVNIHTVKKEKQEVFTERSGQSGEFVSVSVLLADPDPGGNMRNALLGMRTEKIKRSRMEGVRDTGISQLSRYDGPDEVGEKAQEILSRTSTDEMMEETTLFSNGKTIQSIAGEPVPGR